MIFSISGFCWWYFLLSGWYFWCSGFFWNSGAIFLGFCKGVFGWFGGGDLAEGISYFGQRPKLLIPGAKSPQPNHTKKHPQQTTQKSSPPNFKKHPERQKLSPPKAKIIISKHPEIENHHAKITEYILIFFMLGSDEGSRFFFSIL